MNLISLEKRHVKREIQRHKIKRLSDAFKYKWNSSWKTWSFIAFELLLFQIFLVLLPQKLDGADLTWSHVCFPTWMMVFIPNLICGIKKRMTPGLILGLIQCWLILIILKLTGATRTTWFTIFIPIWILMMAFFILSLFFFIKTLRRHIRLQRSIPQDGAELGWFLIAIFSLIISAIWVILILLKADGVSISYWKATSPLFFHLNALFLVFVGVAIAGATQFRSFHMWLTSRGFNPSRYLWCGTGVFFSS
jgi:hypothetical protein